MIKELSDQFPSDRRAIEAFFNDIDRILRLPSDKEDDNPTGPDRRHADERNSIRHLVKCSAADYLERRIKDRRLRRLLGSLGTHIPQSSLLLQAAMWNLLCQEGIWYPHAGMKSFCDSLAQLATPGSTGAAPHDLGSNSAGGIRLRTEVQEILVNHGKIAGVRCADGQTIASPAIISNADYKTTFLKLLPSYATTPWAQAVAEARQTGSNLQVCLGIDRRLADLSVFDLSSRVIYRRDDGTESSADAVNWNKQRISPEAFASQELEFSCWSNDDASVAPKGGAVIVIRTEAPYSHFAAFRLGKGQRTSEYAAYKTSLGTALVNEAARVIPGLTDAIQVMDVASPLTFADQGGRTEGAVAGWSWDYEDFHDYRPRELVRTPIKRLYMAGHQAYTALFMGGVPAAILSGQRAARALLGDEGPIGHLQVPSSSARFRSSPDFD
jgi:phytoene dehydrogenase-like protein